MTKKHMALTGGGLLNYSADGWPWITDGPDGSSMPRWDVRFAGPVHQLVTASHCLDWLIEQWRPTSRTKVRQARIDETLVVIRLLIRMPKRIRGIRHLRTIRGKLAVAIMEENERLYAQQILRK